MSRVLTQQKAKGKKKEFLGMKFSKKEALSCEQI
jgi:hypothetical protein